MEEMVEELQEQRNQLRQDAKRNIQKIQAENKRTYDRKLKKAPGYQIGDLVAIQRTQFGSGFKLRPKFIGPYKIIEVKPRDSDVIDQNNSMLCQITGVSDSRMAELVGNGISLISNNWNVSNNILRERDVIDGGSKQTKLNREANQRIRSADVKRMRHLNAQ
ncbi:uncharacterized protein TNCV_5028701 [Trichonephila clavipes]|nr:uncharacterized protein TNCV_5028701 [Trichonephila clavipes]